MRKLILICFYKSSFTLYKKTLALGLAFVMLFNLTGEVFANLPNIAEEHSELMNTLKQDLGQIYQKNENKKDSIPKTLWQKMQEAKREYVIALAKYHAASQLPEMYKSIETTYSNIIEELKQEKETLDLEKEKIDAEFDSPSFKKYQAEHLSYYTWKIQEELYKSLIDQLETQTAQESQETKAPQKRRKKQNQNTEQTEDPQKRIDILRQEIEQGNKEWQWYEEEDNYVNNILSPKVDVYNKTVETHNYALENIEQDYRVKNNKLMHNYLIEEWFGGQTIPQGMKLKDEDGLEEIQNIYQTTIQNNLNILAAQYEMAAAKYQKATTEYYDDLLGRYQLYEKKTNDSQCALAKQIYEGRQQAKENIDSYGWKAIPWLDKDQLKNTSNQGIRESLIWTWNTCATGIAWTNKDTLDSLNIKNDNITDEEYIKVKFLENYEEYIPENKKVYQTSSYFDEKTEKDHFRFAYDFKISDDAIYQDGIKRGRELFLLLLADYELGYAKYRASVVNSNQAKVIYDYIGDVPSEEDFFEGEKTVKINNYNLHKYYYSIYIDEHDNTFKKIEKKLFRLVKLTENYARGEVNRLAGNLVKKMYFEGKSIKEILAEEGITPAEIEAVYKKYQEEMDPENVERQKAQLKGELEKTDYSNLVAWEVADQFKRTTTDKILDGLFCWLPSTWLGFKHTIDRAKQEYNRQLSYADVHKSLIFKQSLYLLSERPQNWKDYLIPLALKIREKGEDYETANILADLAATQDNIDIKDIAISAERKAFYNLQDDPFFIAKQMIVDLVTMAGVGAFLKGIQAFRASRYASNVAKLNKNVAKQISAVAKKPKTGKVFRPSKKMKGIKIEQPKYKGLDKVKAKIKAEKKTSHIQSVQDKARVQHRKREERAYRRKIREEAKEFDDYHKSAPPLQPRKITWWDLTKASIHSTIEQTWNQIKFGVSGLLGSPRLFAMVTGGLGGEITPAIVIEQTIAERSMEEGTFELIAEVNTATKEGKLVQESALPAAEGQKAANTTRTPTTSDYLLKYQQTHVAPDLEPVSGSRGGTPFPITTQLWYKAKYGVIGLLNAFKQVHKSVVVSQKNTPIEKNFQMMAQETYPYLSAKTVKEYIAKGQEMYKKGEKPIENTDHPITIIAYEQAVEEEQAQQVSESMKQNILGQFASEESIKYRAAATVLLPFIGKKLMHLLTGGAHILSDKKAETLRKLIDEAVKAEVAQTSPAHASFKAKVAQRVEKLVKRAKEFNSFDRLAINGVLSEYIKANKTVASAEASAAQDVSSSQETKRYAIVNRSEVAVQKTVNKNGSITYYNYIPVYLLGRENTLSQTPIFYLKLHEKEKLTIPAGCKFALQADGSITYFVEDIKTVGIKKALKYNNRVAPVEVSLTMERIQQLRDYVLANESKTVLIELNKKDGFEAFSIMLSLIAGADLGASLSSQLKGTFGLLAVAIAISGFGYVSPLLANLFRPLVQKFGRKKMIEAGLIAMTAVSILGACAGMYGTYALDVSNPTSWKFLTGVAFFITAITAASLFSTLASPMLSTAYPNKAVFASKNLSFTTMKGLSRMMVTVIPAIVGLFTSGVNWSLLTPAIGVLSLFALITLQFSRNIDPELATNISKEKAEKVQKQKTSAELKEQYKKLFAPKTKDILRRLGQIYMSYGMITSVIIGVVSGILYEPAFALWLGVGGSTLNFLSRKIANKLLKDKKISDDQLTGFLLPVMAGSIISLLVMPYGYAMLIPWYLTQISTSTFGVAESTRMMNAIGDYYKNAKAEVEADTSLSEEDKAINLNNLIADEAAMKLIATNKYNVRNSFAILPILVTVGLTGVFIDAGIFSQFLDFLGNLPLSSTEDTLNILRVAILFPSIVSAVLVYQNKEMVKEGWKHVKEVIGGEKEFEITKEQIKAHYGKALVYETAMRALLAGEAYPDMEKDFEKYYRKALKELKACGKNNEQASEMKTRLSNLKAQLKVKLGETEASTVDTDERGFFEKVWDYIKEVFATYLPSFSLGEGGFVGAYAPNKEGSDAGSADEGNFTPATLDTQTQQALEKLRDNFLGFSGEVISEINAKIESGEITTMEEVYKTLEEHIATFAIPNILDDDDVDAINNFINSQIDLPTQQEIENILRRADIRDGLTP